MKKLLSLICLVLLASIGFSQAPAIFNYQGVARNSVGNVLVNKSIALRLTIHDGTPAGPVVYQESRGVTTNPFGLFNVQIGSPGATSITGTIPGVNWAVGSKFIQVEIDPNGGTTFINIGTAQLASVPYAWYAQVSGDLVLPYNKTQADAGTLFKITNSGTGAGSVSLEGLTNSTAGNVSAIIGTVTPTSPGGFSSGVRGINNGTGGLGIGVYGSQAGSGWGVYGTTPSGIGVHGASTTGFGVYGLASTTGVGVYGISNTGRSGVFENTNGANTSSTLFVTSNGTGWSGEFISTNATTRALRTQGGLRLTGINEGLNRILASNATGDATWQDPGAIGIVTGSGTLNFVPKWTPNGTNLGNSQIFDNGTSVGINLTTPNAAYRLEVAGIQRINATTNQEGGELRFQEGNLFGPQNNWIIDNFLSFAGGNKFRIWNDAGSMALQMMPTGRVAVGNMVFSEQPQSTLDVEGNLAVGATYSGTNAAPTNGAIIEGNVGIGFTTPNAKLRVEQTAATQSAVLVNKTNAANADNAMNVVSANATATQYGNSAVLGQRGAIGANTYLWVGGAGGTAMTGISSTGIGMQGTSEGGFGMLGLSFNGYGVYGLNLNAGNAGRFENLLNVGNTSPVVFVNSISSPGGVYGLHSNMAATAPGGYSTALRGQHNSTTGNGIGVWGSQNGSGWGVFGETPTGVGVYGISNNGTGGAGYGVWGEAFGANPYSGGVFRGQTGSYYGSYSDNNNVNGFAGAIGWQTNTAPINAFSSGVYGINSAGNGIGYGGRFDHSSNGVGVYGLAGNNGTGVFGQASGTGSRGVRGLSNTGNAALFETSSTSSFNASVYVSDADVSTVWWYKSGIYSELTPINGGTTMLAAVSAIRGVASPNTTIGAAGGTGVQGASVSGYGVVGNATTGTGVFAVSWGSGYGLQTFGKVQIMGQGAALNNVLVSDAVGNATWQPLGALGGVTGTGTNNYITKWTPNGTNIGISQLFDNGTSIGMGTTTPSPAALLDIQNNFTQMRLRDNDQAADVWITAPGLGYTGGIGTGTNHDFPIFTNALDRVTVKADGRVGFGTTNPTGYTEIAGNSSVGFPHIKLNELADDYGRLTFRNTNANNSGNNFWDIAGYTNDNRTFERLNIYNNATGDLVSVTGDGRVGIGTFNPFVKTHINSGTSFDNLLLEARDGANAGPHQYFYSGGEFSLVDYIRTDYTFDAWRRGALEFRGGTRLNLYPTNATAINTGMTILSNNNVGIGTSAPPVEFSVHGTIPWIRAFDTDQLSDMNVIPPGLGYTGGLGTGTNHDLAIFSANVDRLTIKNTGLIGVNNFSPQARIHIVDVNKAFRADAIFAAPTNTAASEFNAQNVSHGLVARLNTTINTTVPFGTSAFTGIDSTGGAFQAGVTGYSIGSPTGGGHFGIYGIASIDRNLATESVGYFPGYSGAQLWGGDYGTIGAVWGTPAVGLDGSNTTKVGVMGFVDYTHPGTNVAIYGFSAVGGVTNNYAGYFNGDVNVVGNFSATGVKAFRIDHPLDPANKYLNHFAVESPEVQNIYNGNIVTDATGKAVVTLPSYFEAINAEFKYQLTIIDETQFAMARVSKKISGNVFEVMTSVPNIEVSWQVTAVRNDKAVQKYAMNAETEKPAGEKGKYLDPDLYGKSDKDRVVYVENMQPKVSEKTTNYTMPVKLPVMPAERKMPQQTQPTDEEINVALKLQQDGMKNWARPLEKPVAEKLGMVQQDGESKKSPILTEEMMKQQNIYKAPVSNDAPTQSKPVSNNASSAATTPTLPSMTVTEAEIRAQKQAMDEQHKKDEAAKNQEQKPVQPNVNQQTKEPVKENKTVEPAGRLEKQPVPEKSKAD